MRGRAYAIAALLALTAAGLRAQGDRGIITGTVKDASGAAMPSASVTAIQLDTNTNYKTNTTASGDFTVPALPVGKYRVRVEHTGFKTQIQDNVEVEPGSTVRMDLAMEVGNTQQTIEVQANAQTLQTETARVSTEVSNRMVNELPIIVGGAVRSPFDLTAYTAEAQGSGDYSSTVGTSGGLRIGGGRIGAFGVTLDGTAVTVARPDAQVSWTGYNSPSVEALTEFSVESGGFKAETGHASGGSISFVSKSGTNNLHGDAYEFRRNQDLDAKGFFGVSKPVYKQNEPQPLYPGWPHPLELADHFGGRGGRWNQPALSVIHPELRHRRDGGPGPQALSAIRPRRYHQWRGRPAGPFHLPLDGSEILEAVFRGPHRAGVLRPFEIDHGLGQL